MPYRSPYTNGAAPEPLNRIHDPNKPVETTQVRETYTFPAPKVLNSPKSPKVQLAVYISVLPLGKSRVPCPEASGLVVQVLDHLLYSIEVYYIILYCYVP